MILFKSKIMVRSIIKLRNVFVLILFTPQPTEPILMMTDDNFVLNSFFFIKLQGVCESQSIIMHTKSQVVKN